MTALTLDSLDLAALLCSKVCHDVINPVGAISIGLEMLDDNPDEETRTAALELVAKSAKSASAKLEYHRLAFGAAGSAGAAIDTGTAEAVARGLFADDKTSLVWLAERVLMPKNKVKLLLNLCLIAASAIPRGGEIQVAITGPAETPVFGVRSKGIYCRLAQTIPALVAGEPETGSVDAHGIQAFYTGLVARACAMAVKIQAQDGAIVIDATPQAA
ncbi:histidine phosphotransferase ChpT [Methylovirgula sp. 4M-Z18]|uniref:histidine phosphotransferase ChpT n=1 Tax=Methylovirgula sp. 4M-Z18 TaxID=2293567 RepID=UPI000E2F8E77|nr:histidine phosphotransferase family protein [Methylovirgula sp. 4M-Z18]RFB78300.1 histidine phosphotransferase [Methylovirgula sp. 4M-Z18]